MLGFLYPLLAAAVRIILVLVWVSLNKGYTVIFIPKLTEIVKHYIYFLTNSSLNATNYRKNLNCNRYDS